MSNRQSATTTTTLRFCCEGADIGVDQSPDLPLPTTVLTYTIECFGCGRTVDAATTEDAVRKWNAATEHSDA